MSKLSRREMLQASAAGVAASAAAALPGSVTLASAPSQDQISMRYQVFNIDAVQDMLNSYMEANPHVSIEAISVTGVDHQEVATKILATLAAGNPVDVGFACTEVTHLYAGEGLAQPLTSRLMDDAEEFMEYYADTSAALSEAMLYEGDVYQLMDTFNAANMFYNKNLLAEAGLEEPGKDWTKDDFYGMAQAMTGIDGSFGYGWVNRFWGSWMPWIFVNDTNVLVEERAPGGEWFWDTFYEGDERAAGRGGGWRWPAPQANNPRVVEALEFMVAMIQEGLTPAVEMGSGNTLQGFFTSNKLGMTPAGGFWAGGLYNAGMEPGTFEAQFWPSWRTQRHQLGICGPWILDGGPNADQCWDFLKHYKERDVQAGLGYFNPVPATTPSRRSLNTEERWGPTGVKNWRIFYETIDERPDTGPIAQPVFVVELTNIFTRYTSLATSGEQTPKEALDNMQAEMEDLYARNA